MPSTGAILVLVPSALELAGLRALSDGGGLGSLELCGIGPVLAAARTAERLAQCRPAGVLLLGIAGSLDGERYRPGSAYRFGGARLEGVGVGRGDSFKAASRVGLAQWPGGERGGAIYEELCWEESASARPWLLSVCSASGTAQEGAVRGQQAAHCVAEEMEAFAVAAACALQGVKLAVLRGISNLAGERDKRRWCIDQALASLLPLAHATLAERSTWQVPHAQGLTP